MLLERISISDRRWEINQWAFGMRQYFVSHISGNIAGDTSTLWFDGKQWRSTDTALERISISSRRFLDDFSDLFDSIWRLSNYTSNGRFHYIIRGRIDLTTQRLCAWRLCCCYFAHWIELSGGFFDNCRWLGRTKAFDGRHFDAVAAFVWTNWHWWQARLIGRYLEWLRRWIIGTQKCLFLIIYVALTLTFEETVIRITFAAAWRRTLLKPQRFRLLFSLFLENLRKLRIKTKGWWCVWRLDFFYYTLAFFGMKTLSVESIWFKNTYIQYRTIW